ncbi:MAG: 8-oxoguanine DNA glycosylase [Firmicutes bacterium]|nr:8-oxoguanine DNA glycosylase [Bacillota bacterium]
MKYNIIEENNNIIIKNIKNFIPEHIFECGQCFRWKKNEDGSYTVVAYKRVINVFKNGNDLYIRNTNMKDFKEIWYDYFDLDTDYEEIKRKLSNDKVLKEAIKFGEGIRILNQDEWEILISFIISANNRIPMIKRAIEKLSKEYGEFIETFEGKDYYTFPKAKDLYNLTIEDVKKCSTGFRAKYIVKAAKIVHNKEINLYNIKNLQTDKARKDLMKFSGVGPKVSDCIMLFSMNKRDAFPIDVWVKRIMEYFYLDSDEKLKNIQKYAQNKFMDLAGFAQQYLFYYARELGIGK